jgi:hypothetical protein
MAISVILLPLAFPPVVSISYRNSVFHLLCNVNCIVILVQNFKKALPPLPKTVKISQDTKKVSKSRYKLFFHLFVLYVTKLVIDDNKFCCICCYKL